MWDVENLRNNVYGSLNLGSLKTIGERLNDIEADVNIITESYGFGDQTSDSRDETLDELNTLYDTFKKEFDDLECKISRKK